MKYDEYLDDVPNEDWRQALKRCVDAYQRLKNAGVDFEPAALLVVAAQIDWLSTVLANLSDDE